LFTKQQSEMAKIVPHTVFFMDDDTVSNQQDMETNLKESATPKTQAQYPRNVNCLLSPHEHHEQRRTALKS